MRGVKSAALRWSIVRLLALAGILGLLGAACKSPTSPKGNGEADISITNGYGEALDIYLDGSFQFTLRWGTTIEIDDVTLYHEYTLEARGPAPGISSIRRSSMSRRNQVQLDDPPRAAHLRDQ